MKSLSAKNLFLFAGATEYFKESAVKKLSIMKLITMLPVPEEVALEDRIPFAKAKELCDTFQAKMSEVAELGSKAEMSDEGVQPVINLMYEIHDLMEEADAILAVIQGYTRRKLTEMASEGCDGECDCCGGSCSDGE